MCVCTQYAHIETLLFLIDDKPNNFQADADSAYNTRVHVQCFTILWGTHTSKTLTVVYFVTQQKTP